jgi:hypothetical protein
MTIMDKLSQLWRRLLFYARRDQFNRELEEEMRFHLEMKAEENLASDASLEEARYAAQRQFGNQTLLQEVSREMWSFRSLETLVQDLRYGARMLLKNPGFTTIAALTLALGIGANTAIFSLTSALLLRPFDFHDLDRLVCVYETEPQQGDFLSGMGLFWPGCFPIVKFELDRRGRAGTRAEFRSHSGILPAAWSRGRIGARVFTRRRAGRARSGGGAWVRSMATALRRRSQDHRRDNLAR